MSAAKRVLTGLGQAAWSGVACALIAIAIYAREGDTIVREGGVNLQDRLLVYAAVTFVSGVLLGLLQPLAKTCWGTALVSIPIAWPPALSIMLFARQGKLGDLDAIDYAVSIALAAIFGPLTAVYIRIRERDRPAK